MTINEMTKYDGYADYCYDTWRDHQAEREKETANEDYALYQAYLIEQAIEDGILTDADLIAPNIYEPELGPTEDPATVLAAALDDLGINSEQAGKHAWDLGGRDLIRLFWAD